MYSSLIFSELFVNYSNPSRMNLKLTLFLSVVGFISACSEAVSKTQY